MKKIIDQISNIEISKIIQECLHNNKILITLSIINLIIMCLFFVNPFKYPVSNNPIVSGKTPLFSNDTTVIQEFTSNVDDLKSISFTMKALNGKDKNGEIYYSIYNDESIIFSDAIKTNKINKSLIEMNFKNQKNSKNKKYYIKIQIKNMNEKNSIYFNAVNDEKGTDISINNNNLNLQIAINQMGDSKTYVPSMIFAIILFCNLLMLFQCNIKKIKFKNGIFAKIIYFVLSSVLAFLIFKILYSYNYYNNYISIVYVVMIILILIILAFFASIILYKNKTKIENIFLIIAIPLSLLYSAFVLYGNVPDEIAHYNRAYQISNMEILKTNESKIPKIIAEQKTSYYGIIESYKLQDEKEKMVKTDYTGANYYNPVLYISTSIAIKTGNIFHIPVVYIFYFARVLNLIIFIICGYFSIKLIPVGKLVLLIYMMNPMFLHQAASLSADSIINSTVIMFISYVLYLKYENKDIKLKNIFILLLLSLYVLVGKYAYFPILLLLFLLKKNIKKMKKKDKKIMMIGIVTILIYFIASFLYMKIAPKSLMPSVSFSKQYDVIKISDSALLNIINNPLRYFLVIFNTLRYSLTFYLYSFAGGFPGSLEFQIKPYISIIYLFILFAAPFLSKEKIELSKKSKILFILIFLLVFNAIFYAFYDALTQINGTSIGGIQGRYFIPIVILLLLTCIKKNHFIQLKNQSILYIILAFINFITLFGIFKFYL